MNDQYKNSYKATAKELVSLSVCDYLFVHCRQHLNIFLNRSDVRRADKSHRNRPQTGKFSLRVKTSELTPVGIPHRRHIHRRKARRSALDLLGQKQKPRARSIHRKPCRNLCPKRLIKPQLIQELTHRGTLAARQNQSVHRPLQIRKLPDLKRLCAQSPYHGNVFGKRALHRQHAYLFFLHLTVPALPSKSQSHSH